MNEEYDDWEKFAGKLIVSFGEIELITYKLFEFLQFEEKAAEYTLDQRLSKLIGHIDRQEDSITLQKEKMKDLLISAKKLNDIRNLVSHNPAILHRDFGAYYEKFLTDLRGEMTPITIEQLQEYADEVTDLKAQLFICASQYTNRGIDAFIT